MPGETFRENNPAIEKPIESQNQVSKDKPENDLDKKLYILRDIEGEKNEKFIEALRYIEKELSQHPWFIGIAPYGSQTKGYATEDSDIDVYIFADIDFPAPNSILDLILDLDGKVKEKFGFDVHHQVRDVGKERLVRIFNEVGFSEFFAIDELKVMSKMAIGPKIDTLRQYVREIIESLPEERRDKILNRALYFIQQEEAKSGEKIRQRLSISDEEWEQIKKERMDLWKRRLETLWGYELKA